VWRSIGPLLIEDGEKHHMPEKREDKRIIGFRQDVSYNTGTQFFTKAGLRIVYQSDDSQTPALFGLFWAAERIFFRVYLRRISHDNEFVLNSQCPQV